MDNKQLECVITRWEGKRNVVYKDTRGLLTCGIGHLILPSDNLQLGDTVSDGQVAAWFAKDIQRSILLCKNYVPALDTLDDVRAIVLISLAYNLGNRLGQFVNMLHAINNQNWDEAAVQLRASLWATQVGKYRSQETIDALRSGFFSFSSC